MFELIKDLWIKKLIQVIHLDNAVTNGIITMEESVIIKALPQEPSEISLKLNDMLTDMWKCKCLDEKLLRIAVRESWITLDELNIIVKLPQDLIHKTYSKMYYSLSYMYKENKLSLQQLNKALEIKWITQTEYNNILSL